MCLREKIGQEDTLVSSVVLWIPQHTKSGHAFLDQGIFDSFLGSFKGLVEMMSVFHKLTSSPLMLK